MTAAGRTIQCIFSAVVFLMLFLSALSTDVCALIPEPDNIIYGVLPAANTTISLKIDENIVASYTRGENPAAGEYFVLKVPIDAVDPQQSGTVRPGTVADLFLDAETDPAQTVVIGEKGDLQRIVLVITPIDTDSDGIEDSIDNCPDIANNDQDDANSDGQGDACDGDSDTDRDGYMDNQEYINYLNSILDPNGDTFDALVANAPNGVGYTGVHPSKMLPPILLIIMEEEL